MIIKELILLFIFVLILLALMFVTMIFVMQGHDRNRKFQARLEGVVAPGGRGPNPADEALSLTKTVSRMEQIKEKAARIIGVDLQQSETYPIKWWLVPPLTLLTTGVIIELALHPLSNFKLLLYAAFPVIWLLEITTL